MSALTKLLRVDRYPAHISPKTGSKSPMMMEIDVPDGFDPTCISLASGRLHMVKVLSGRPVRTGFFVLEEDAEDAYMADMMTFAHTYGVAHEWASSLQAEKIEPLLPDISTYFKAYDIETFKVFTGQEGLESLRDIFDVFPPDTSHLALLKQMEEDFALGMIRESPVFYNPHLKHLVIFAAPAQAIGVLTRVGEYVSVLVHNFERAVLTVDTEKYDSGKLPRKPTDHLPDTRMEEPGD